MNVSFVSARPNSDAWSGWSSVECNMNCESGDSFIVIKSKTCKVFTTKQDAILDAQRLSREKDMSFVPNDRGIVVVYPNPRGFTVIETFPSNGKSGISSLTVRDSHEYSNTAITQAQEISKLKGLACLIPRLYS